MTTTKPPSRAHVFPPVLQKSWRVVAGRVQTRSLEAHVVDHCNLRCAECCSLSPLLPVWSANVDDLARDLERARRVLQPAVFKLVGGEPTLHKDLTALVVAVKQSQIAPRVSVTTNGLLLATMPDAFFAAVDALTISLYPQPALKQDVIDDVNARAAAFHVELNWKVQDQFVTMNRSVRCDDDNENQRVYDDCWLRERCHIVRDGVFYMCTRPPHVRSLLGTGNDGGYDDDGLALDDAVTADAVVAYLTRPKPLATCALCLGGSAPQTAHRQIAKDAVAATRDALRIVAT